MVNVRPAKTLVWLGLNEREGWWEEVVTEVIQGGGKRTEVKIKLHSETAAC